MKHKDYKIGDYIWVYKPGHNATAAFLSAPLFPFLKTNKSRKIKIGDKCLATSKGIQGSFFTMGTPVTIIEIEAYERTPLYSFRVTGKGVSNTEVQYWVEAEAIVLDEGFPLKNVKLEQIIKTVEVQKAQKEAYEKEARYHQVCADCLKYMAVIISVENETFIVRFKNWEFTAHWKEDEWHFMIQHQDVMPLVQKINDPVNKSIFMDGMVKIGAVGKYQSSTFADIFDHIAPGTGVKGKGDPGLPKKNIFASTQPNASDSKFVAPYPTVSPVWGKGEDEFGEIGPVDETEEDALFDMAPTAEEIEEDFANVPLVPGMEQLTKTADAATKAAQIFAAVSGISMQEAVDILAASLKANKITKNTKEIKKPKKPKKPKKKKKPYGRKLNI